MTMMILEETDLGPLGLLRPVPGYTADDGPMVMVDVHPFRIRAFPDMRQLYELLRDHRLRDDTLAQLMIEIQHCGSGVIMPCRCVSNHTQYPWKTRIVVEHGTSEQSCWACWRCGVGMYDEKFRLACVNCNVSQLPAPALQAIGSCTHCGEPMEVRGIIGTHQQEVRSEDERSSIVAFPGKTGRS